MTEKQWLVCTDSAFRMLDFLRNRASGRKLRLFGCACCRSLWHLLCDAKVRQAVVAVELVAEGEANKQQLKALRDYFRSHKGSQSRGFGYRTARWAVEGLVKPGDWQAAYSAAIAAIDAVVGSTAAGKEHTIAGQKAKQVVKVQREREQAELLRHIIGNPFRPYPVPYHWPTAVVRLAEAQYAGEKCTFALHDSLLESGHPDLAEHFREPAHPKGCWALDQLLGKE